MICSFVSSFIWGLDRHGTEQRNNLLIAAASEGVLPGAEFLKITFKLIIWRQKHLSHRNYLPRFCLIVCQNVFDDRVFATKFALFLIGRVRV